jgi:thiol-disulfide isomerase/thioredoxin
MKKNKLAVYGLVAVIFGAIGAWYGTRHKAEAPPPITATVAPNVTGPSKTLYSQRMTDVKGVEQQLAQWQGKALLVNFWAPWCAPCVEEMPELSELQTASAGKNLQIIGIGIDSQANIAEFAQRMKITYPLYVGGIGGSDLSRTFGNTQGGLPFTVLIGADGQVKKTYLGRLKFDQLRSDLSSL